jgi:hypothetical protein
MSCISIKTVKNAKISILGSRYKDFEVCFLVPSDIADLTMLTLQSGFVFKKKVDFVSNFRLFGSWHG